MAALTAVQLTVAPLVVIDDDVKPAGAVHGTSVLNCAAANALVPLAQVALTLQS